MKKTFIFVAVLMMLGVSCSKKDNSTSVKNVVVSTVSTGTWKITYFFDSNIESTASFSAYNFTFGPSNTLSASNGTNTYTGTWMVTNNNSQDDSLDDVDFTLSFLTPSSFESLSEDWSIISRTASKIELSHVSGGGGGGTDLLTFEIN